MADIGGFPTTRVLFDKNAVLVDPDAPAAAEEMIAGRNITDLLVLCHGWNNDMTEAEALYEELATNIRAQKDRRQSQRTRRYAILAVFWPSKKFADAHLIAGGAASLGGADESLVTEMLDDLKGTFDGPAADERLQQAKEYVRNLEDDPAARRAFADLVRQVVSPVGVEALDSSDRFFDCDGSELVDALSTTGEDEEVVDPDAGGAAGAAVGASVEADGGAQGLGDLFGGAFAGARNVLNYVTYYQMKERAGLIGGQGLNPVVSRLRLRFRDLKVHLIGHSFGGRVAVATVNAASNGVDVVCDTLTLLQAAFSHYGLSDNWDGRGGRGAFSRILAAPPRVRGPVVITCTRNDRAVGVAYAIASRLAGQVASALGDENDTFGGIGSNGAQQTRNTRHRMLLPHGEEYPPFEPGAVYNLKTASLIGDHGDVRNPAVANAVVAAIASV